MKEFFYPSSIAVFGVANSPRNLAKNIIANSEEMGFEGDIFAVGREGGSINGRTILENGDDLPTGIDLAVILVPAKVVPKALESCARRGIRHAVISTGGYREFDDRDNEAERRLIAVAKEHGIRFIGPNCIGIICTNSGLCTPFNPMEPSHHRKGRVSIIAQSGGVATQATCQFSDEYVGFSKIISAGNKLDIDEVNLIEYLMNDDDTDQIHLYLESIEKGRDLLGVVERCTKPIVVFKANVSRTSARVAKSHTAALANNDAVLDGFLKQTGIVRVGDIHDMTVCAKALRLPPLRGNRIVVISVSGGFAVILGDACEAQGFECPPLPRELLDEIEAFRRAGVIKMSNPMDFGDVHDIPALIFALDRCLSLDYIDGLVLCLGYSPNFERIFGETGNLGEPLFNSVKEICLQHGKPVALSFFSEKRYIEEFKRMDTFPVFSTPEESVRALGMLRSYWRNRPAPENNSGDD